MTTTSFETCSSGVRCWMQTNNYINVCTHSEEIGLSGDATSFPIADVDVRMKQYFICFFHKALF